MRRVAKIKISGARGRGGAGVRGIGAASYGKYALSLMIKPYHKHVINLTVKPRNEHANGLTI